MVHRGLGFLDAEAENILTHGLTPEGKTLDKDQRAFYQSIRIVLGGIRKMAANLEREALVLAEKTQGDEKERLLGLARSLGHVP